MLRHMTRQEHSSLAELLDDLDRHVEALKRLGLEANAEVRPAIGAVARLREAHQRRSLWLIATKNATPFPKHEDKAETSGSAPARKHARLVKCNVCGVKVKSTRLQTHRREVHGAETTGFRPFAQGGLPSLGKRR